MKKVRSAGIEISADTKPTPTRKTIPFKDNRRRIRYDRVLQAVAKGKTGGQGKKLNGVRKSAEAKRIAARAYPYRCCVVCGRTSPLQVAHLDHDPGNNAADNLAWMCPSCHWNYDGDLLPVEAIRILGPRWQQTNGVHFRKDPKMVVATGKANPFRQSSGAGQRTETVLAFLANGPRPDSEVRRLSGVRSSTVNTEGEERLSGISRFSCVA
jgi:hypothetical protein